MEKLKLFWRKCLKFLKLFYLQTPCKECLRSRLWFMFFIGGLITWLIAESGLISGWQVFSIGFILSMIHVGRSKNWWIKDDNQ